MTATQLTERLKRLNRRAGWPIRIAIIVGAAALVALKVDRQAFVAAIHPASWAFVVAAVGANGASVIFKGLAWKSVVDGLEGMRRRARVRDLVSPLFVGFLFNTLLAARLGEFVKVILARRHLVARGENIRTTTLLGTVVVENLMSTLALVVVVVGVGLFLPLTRAIWISSAALGALCLTIVLVALLRQPSRRRPAWMSTSRIWARVSRGAHQFWSAIRDSHVGLRNPAQASKIVAFSIASWLAQMSGIYFALRAFGLDEVGWAGAGLLLVSVTVAQIFPILPGNLGVFQAAVVVPLTHTFPVSSAGALAFSVGLQATEVIVGVAIGFIFLMVEGTTFRELRAEAESQGEPISAAFADPLAGP